ncbi:hypothetical protein BXT84_10730 [Sulfobacillus thermotolerans]|uniref:Uncharacterized protein n=1 Tax=Sulfobacillus thermotolerans TaxID=338644 RepID=A0ABM6RSU5_9FIRM|nr:hypothetical protein BXT84_10730 [Sulfobacillus thermotolerans]
METLIGLLEMEQELEQWLQETSAPVLLIELPFRNKGLVLESLRSLIDELGKNAFEEFARLYPLTFSRWLVDEAVDVYEDGALWPRIAALLYIPETWTNECGRAFYNAVQNLGLQTHHGGKQFVATILAHGAIPTQELPALFRLLQNVLSHLPRSSSGDVILRKLRELPALTYQSKPIRRFLFNAPSNFVKGYLQEMATMLMNGPNSDCRRSLQQGYRLFQLGDQHPVKLSVRKKRPYLRLGLEPQDTHPMVLVFPECETSSEKSPWRIYTSLGDMVVNWPPPSSLQIDRYRHSLWEVELDKPRLWLDIWYQDTFVEEISIRQPVLIFSDDGTLYKHPWLLKGRFYFILMAPGWRIINKDLIRGESPAYFGDWSGYHILSIEALGPALEWTGPQGNGKMLILVQPSVDKYIRVLSDQIPIIRVIGLPVDADFAPMDFTIRNLASETTVTLSEGEVLIDDNRISLDVSRAIPSFGQYSLHIHGPYGINDSVDVDYGPFIQWQVPETVRWPHVETGQYPLGCISATYNPETTVTVSDSWRVKSTRSGYTEYWVGGYEFHLGLNVYYQSQTYSPSVVLREITWEWTSKQYAKIENAPLRITWEQFLHDEWTLEWHCRTGNEMELSLWDKTRILKTLGLRQTGKSYVINDLIRDEIQRESSTEFRLMAQIRDNHEVRSFPILFLQRAAPRDIVLHENDAIIRLSWRGHYVSNVSGFITSLLGLYDPVQFSFKQVLRHGEHFEIIVDHPKYKGPTIVKIKGDKGGILQWHGLLNRGGTGNLTPFMKRVQRWISDREDAPFPESSHDYVLWVEGLVFLSSGQTSRAVNYIILSHLRKAASRWITAALMSTRPRHNLFILGLPQWKIFDTVGSLDMSALIKQLDAVGKKSKVLAWLLGNSCYKFDEYLAIAVFGEQGTEISRTLSNGEFSTETRRMFMSIIKSQIYPVSFGESLEPPILDVDRQWLSQMVNILGKGRHLVHDYISWAVHALYTEEVSIGYLALLQRAVARGMLEINEGRLLHIQQKLSTNWWLVYERELARSELLCSILEDIDQRREYR